eukprot:m.207373 g.207373  ORF g.207373 m.207373 type:complete len:60 (+) comp15802_c0_seq31:770-949(+)
MSDWYLESANHTCGNFAADVNEIEAAGLHTLKSKFAAAPRLAESAVQMECEVPACKRFQ